MVTATTASYEKSMYAVGTRATPNLGVYEGLLYQQYELSTFLKGTIQHTELRWEPVKQLTKEDIKGCQDQ